MPLQGIVLGNIWLGGVSLKDYKIIWKIKMAKMQKIILGGSYFVFFADASKKSVIVRTKHLCTSERPYLGLQENALDY